LAVIAALDEVKRDIGSARRARHVIRKPWSVPYCIVWMTCPLLPYQL
jgi:hypothetical protein